MNADTTGPTKIDLFIHAPLDLGTPISVPVRRSRALDELCEAFNRNSKWSWRPSKPLNAPALSADFVTRFLPITAMIVQDQVLTPESLELWGIPAEFASSVVFSESI